MARTYKRLGYWGGRSIRGHRRSEQNHKEIRPGARVPDPWWDYPPCDLCYIPYKVAFALHKKGWDNGRIRRHLRWKFKLREDEVDQMGLSWYWKCECKQCQEDRRNRYGY